MVIAYPFRRRTMLMLKSSISHWNSWAQCWTTATQRSCSLSRLQAAVTDLKQSVFCIDLSLSLLKIWSNGRRQCLVFRHSQWSHRRLTWSNLSNSFTLDQHRFLNPILLNYAKVFRPCHHSSISNWIFPGLMKVIFHQYWFLASSTYPGFMCIISITRFFFTQDLHIFSRDLLCAFSAIG